MQQLKNFQLRHRSKFSQLILLNDQAVVVSSCDSIFNTKQVQGHPVTQWFPFMESIYSNIWNLSHDQSNIRFNKIETPIPELPGIYDFTFSKVVLDQQPLVLWGIYDYSDLYEDFKQFQQRKNELEIHRETLERRHKHLKSREDIKTQQNIIIESLDHLQLTYFNKIKSALLSPVNVLDGITFLISQALEQRDIKYTQQLRQSIKQLNLILDELENVDSESRPNFTEQAFNPVEISMELSKFISANISHEVNLQYEIDKQLPQLVYGNALYLRQILFGILLNPISLNISSTFIIKIDQVHRSEEEVSIQYNIIEYLHKKAPFISENDYTNLTYRLSLVKQLIDLQNGNISIERIPKELSISIAFTIKYRKAPH